MTFKRSHDTRDGGVVTLGGCQFLQPSPKRACVGDLAGDYQAVGIAPITPSPQFECSRTDSNMDCDCDPARPVSAVMASAAFDSLRPVSFFLSTPSPAPATPAFAPPQSEALWRCVSEFNFILEANFNRLPSNGLTAYHSYTRGRKDAVWQAFCRSQVRFLSPCMPYLFLKRFTVLLLNVHDTERSNFGRQLLAVHGSESTTTAVCSSSALLTMLFAYPPARRAPQAPPQAASCRPSCHWSATRSKALWHRTMKHPSFWFPSASLPGWKAGAWRTGRAAMAWPRRCCCMRTAATPASSRGLSRHARCSCRCLLDSWTAE